MRHFCLCLVGASWKTDFWAVATNGPSNIAATFYALQQKYVFKPLLQKRVSQNDHQPILVEGRSRFRILQRRMKKQQVALMKWLHLLLTVSFPQPLWADRAVGASRDIFMSPNHIRICLLPLHAQSHIPSPAFSPSPTCHCCFPSYPGGGGLSRAITASLADLGMGQTQLWAAEVAVEYEYKPTVCALIAKRKKIQQNIALYHQECHLQVKGILQTNALFGTCKTSPVSSFGFQTSKKMWKDVDRLERMENLLEAWET